LYCNILLKCDSSSIILKKYAKIPLIINFTNIYGRDRYHTLIK